MAAQRRLPGPREVQRILNEYLAGSPDLREAEAEIEQIRRACERNVHAAQAALDRMTVSGDPDDEPSEFFLNSGLDRSGRHSNRRRTH